MDISQNIRKIRESKGMTQAVIAEALNIDRANYSRLEKRGEKLSVEQLQSIADALGVSLGELLEIEKSDPAPDSGRVKELEKMVELLDKERQRHMSFFEQLFRKLDHLIVYTAYSEGMVTEIDLNPYIKKVKLGGREEVQLNYVYKGNFPNYESFTSSVLSPKEIGDVIEVFITRNIFEMQTLLKMYNLDLLPNDSLKDTLKDLIEGNEDLYSKYMESIITYGLRLRNLWSH